MMAVITHTVPLLPGPLTCAGSWFLLQNEIQQSLGSGPKARPGMKAWAEREKEREGKKRETEVARESNAIRMFPARDERESEVCSFK